MFYSSDGSPVILNNFTLIYSLGNKVTFFWGSILFIHLYFAEATAHLRGQEVLPVSEGAMSGGVRDLLPHLLVLGEPHPDSAETLCHSQTWGRLQKVSPHHDIHHSIFFFSSYQGFISPCKQTCFTWLKCAFELKKGC